MPYDVVLRGGRVIDPETGLDALRDVAVDKGQVVEVTERLGLRGLCDVDVTGLVVAPGFVDLHSHAGGVAGMRLQALDGVTTALELEAGALPVELAYRRAEHEGRPINFGFATSWAMARMAVLADLPADGDVATLLCHLGDPRWQQPATSTEINKILDLLEHDLAAGALGIGILVGYAPEIAPSEYLDVARLAARVGAPTFTHARDLTENSPGTRIDGAEEIVRAAAETGAQMHYCHVNSTSRRHLDRVLALVERCRAEGSRVSTEAYPYGSGMTGIGAAFLDPDLLFRWGIEPRNLILAETGERIADAARLRQLRAAGAGLVVVEFFDESDPVDGAFLLQALEFPGAIVASDAMPLTWRGATPSPSIWPLPPGAVTHPRSAGTFSRSLWLLTSAGMPLIEAVGKCSLLPAQLLEASAPRMRGKGRLQPGCDADLVVFNPDEIRDQATYAASTLPSAGIVHLFVAGECVVRSGQLVTTAMPGRPVRSGAE
jgi:N-acyl-D-aspartate/D-glutamate deacylase